MNPKIKIEVGSVQETLILPLYARKIANELYPFYYEDPLVEEIIDRLDYDFSKCEKKANSFSFQFGALEVAMRQFGVKKEIEYFLNEHPTGSIINMGCGLDDMGEILDNGERKLYNIDFSDNINLRNALIASDERTFNYAHDLNDYSWMDKIDGSNGCLFFACGVFYYFYYEQVKQLTLELSKRFPGSILVFDAAGKAASKMINKSVLKKSGMGESVQAYFYFKDPEKEIKEWSNSLEVTAKGYMCGYADLNQDKRIEWLFRKLSKFGDKGMKMRLVRVDL